MNPKIQLVEAPRRLTAGVILCLLRSALSLRLRESHKVTSRKTRDKAGG